MARGQGKSQFDQKEQVKAQHILIKADKGDPRADANALEKAKTLRAQAMKGDFGTVAEKNSDDPGSKTKKGELGYFSRGQMVPEFEEVAFKMKVGEVSEPVRTQFGYHVIKLLDKKAASEASYEKNKTDVAQILLARDQVTAQKTKLEDAFKNGDDKAFLAKMNLSWKDTAPFDMGADAIPGLASAKVVDSLSDIIADSSKPHVIRDGDTQYIVKVKDIKNVQSTDTKTAANESIQKTRAQDLFEGWILNFRESSKVDVNPDVLPNATP